MGTSDQRPALWRRTPADAADWFEPNAIDRARRYARPTKRVDAVTTAVGVAALCALIASHALPRLLGHAGVRNWVVGVAIGVALLSLLEAVIGLPQKWWTSMVHDKRWDLSTETPAGWVKDQLKELVLGIVLLSVLLIPVFWVIRSTRWWWLLGAGVLMIVQLIFAFIYPVLIMPRFNRFTPLANDELARRIDDVAELAGVSIKGAYTMDASKRSRRDNAFVAGYGPTKRVVIFDTLLEHPDRTVEHVVAHEIGHYRLRHLLSQVPASLVVTALSFAGVAAVCAWPPVLRLAGVHRLGDPGAVPLFFLVFVGMQTVSSLLTSALSRHHEREADLEALRLLRDPAAMIDVWRRLAPKNLMDLEPSLPARLRASHPPVAERMAFAQRWAVLNPDPAAGHADGAARGDHPAGRDHPADPA